MKTSVDRVQELDVLRGIAIIGMVLSGSIAFGGLLPAWMYHAQVPPPNHQFDPTRPGITWVDLVFPLFLFCMGAAMPLSIKTQLDKGLTRFSLFSVAVRRFFQLLFFALFSQHLKAWVLSKDQSFLDQLLSIVAFLLLFGQLFDFKKIVTENWGKLIKLISYLAAGLLLYRLPFKDGNGFDFYRSDIIIVVLANMALFGTLIYLFTYQRPYWRVAVLVVVAGIIITAREPGENIVKSFFNFHSIWGLAFDWAYKFYFLKYLFIVIPGMWAGELFLAVNSKTHEAYSFKNTIWSFLTLGLLIALLSLLFIRDQALLCWAVLLVLVIAAWCRKLLEQYTVLTYALTRYGLFFLLMGLILEPFEGGIKKDPSTFSYYFMTTGYGFLMLVVSKDLSGINWLRAIRFWFAGLGKNPLVAYVAGSLLILPLLSISGLRVHWDSWVSTPWQGFLKGVIFTAMVSALTLFFNRKNWIWRS
ncbi:MAG: DUF5009 domain-containing protein [Bacteroidota bacterium]